MFFINWNYIIFVLPALIFSLFASSYVKSTFSKYSKILSNNNITGAQAARDLLDRNGLYNVRIEQTRGNLTDHYDPRYNVIRLSESVYNNTSIAAIGVACHEAGHALQYAKNYFPIKLRNFIIPITNIGSRLSMPLILLGILLSSLGENYAIVAYIGVLLFGFSVLFQLITLPVEFNASKRAIKCIKEYNYLYEDEANNAKSVLFAAALTYVAALAVSVSQFMYLLSLVNRISRRR